MKKLILKPQQQIKVWRYFDLLHRCLKKRGLTFTKTDVQKLPSKYNRLVKKGLQAKNTLYQCVQGIAVDFAHRYSNPSSVSFDELFQQAQLGIHAAIVRYNPNPKKIQQLAVFSAETLPNKGPVAFSSYAFMWIRAKVFERLQHQSLIKAPKNNKEVYAIVYPEDTGTLDDYCNEETISTLNELAQHLKDDEAILLDYVDNPLLAAMTLGITFDDAQLQIDNLKLKINNLNI